jgi:hypothetical protein
MSFPLIKEVGDRWSWFEDYIYAHAVYTVNCPVDRECQVGMGIFAFGEPRGEKIRFSGHRKFITIGFGSLHVRCVDGKGSCIVRIDQGDVGLITIYKKQF